MIKLVREKVNRVSVGVTAIIDYSGFSATLDLLGSTKTLSDLSAKNLWLEFSPSEVEKIEDTTYGTLTVLNKENKIHTKCLVTFSAVDTEREAAGWQRLIITLVALLKYEGSRRDPSGGGGGGGGGGDDPEDTREIVRNTPITVTDPEGHQETITVSQMAGMVVDINAEVEDARKKHLTGYTEDEDSDGQPDNETLYLKPEVKG